MAVGRQRDIDLAGTDIAGAETARGQRARPVALDEHIRLGSQRAKLRPAALLAQIDEGRELAVARVHDERGRKGQMRPGNAHDLGAVLGERAPGGRPGQHAGEVQHANARKRTIAAARGHRRAVPDTLDRHRR